MHMSYDSTELIDNVLIDISLYGDSFKVYAIYDCRENFSFIKKYIDAEQPTMEDGETKESFEKILEAYKNDIKNLRNKKHELMSLSALLPLLIEQNRIF